MFISTVSLETIINSFWAFERGDANSGPSVIVKDDAETQIGVFTIGIEAELLFHLTTAHNSYLKYRNKIARERNKDL